MGVTKYLDTVGWDGDKRKYRIWTWAEVHRPGDYQVPHTHAQALASGVYAARTNGFQDLVFEDLRGQVAPFARQHHEKLDPGRVVVTSSWALRRLMPNAGNTTNVYWCFWVVPQEGANSVDPEEDPAGEFVLKR